ncbi:lipoprotein-releasing system ATP-binding protein LolD [Candidatus Woesearchaeota archaeon CG_4_10_14_0_2_um_filter_57_5]|nr:MAG: ABC transporter ATP-binding protein [Candidatus Woesearchaeota archaeon CG1_02_57_44]PIN70941.1 MAG: lipoprotein-releasing system ATP-binding protein LolD [Candidatus Woesearchaeota archaeon CG11_big_fil_rev_8_21_14_0_20_57_5]PIZ55775.1 MAG: lipoprotein-releasing system ATP-binding protein LolD [Candidatus Woesearchaeota archaeon CG_4_10_14_0_2_um_filter_57_5]
MTRPIVELRNVVKTYTMGEAQVHALAGVNISIMPGDFVAISGPSGSGKSTCMNLVGCLDLPTSGHIFLSGNDISAMGESELAGIRGHTIGFIFQQFNLIGTLTAMENVMLPLMFQGKTDAEQLTRARELLNLVDLGDRMHHRPSELSGGQQQRVAIARALANDPDMILADEPTGNLDSATGKHIMELLTKLHQKDKKTIVLVTHDPSLLSYAERVIRLADGKVVKDTGAIGSRSNDKGGKHDETTHKEGKHDDKQRHETKR